VGGDVVTHLHQVSGAAEGRRESVGLRRFRASLVEPTP
jgi:hypothetical protein